MPIHAQSTNGSIKPHTLNIKVKYIIYIIFLLNLILLCGDVHPNPGPITTTDSLSVFFLNAQSIKSKITDYLHMIDILQPDVIAINETWLIDGIPDSAFADGDTYCNPKILYGIYTSAKQLK